jgi:FecR protein
MRRGIAGLVAGLAFVGASVLAGASSFADGPDQGSTALPDAPQAVPPNPNRPVVARISVIDGRDVTVQHGDSQKQFAGAVNAPLLPGDFITTGSGTRAEVQLDGFTMLRLSQNVQARIVTSTVRSHQIQIAAGTVVLSVLHSGGAATQIDTPSITVSAIKSGDVRISVDADGSTSATARSGSATLETPQQQYDMESGTTYLASGSASRPTVTEVKEVAFDGFDDFNAQRDKIAYSALDATTDEPHGVAGYDNLNRYGRWVDVSPYGQVWTPNGVGSDWAPYRDGQWTWTAGYGWTWVSSESWGWVPYHYGRWFFQTDVGWCWVPPSSDASPAWQPALVGFFGYGAGGTGDFGWAPLAPGEGYYPGYGYNTGFIYNPGWPGWYNNGGNPTPQPRPTPGRKVPDPQRKPVPIRSTPFHNMAFGGATGVDAQSFHNGDFSHARPVDVTHIQNVTALHGALPVVPSAENYGFTRAQVNTPVTISHAFYAPHFTMQLMRAQAQSWDRSSDPRGYGPYGSHAIPYPGQYRGAPYPGQYSPRSQPSRSQPAQPVRAAPAEPSRPSSDRSSGSRPPSR